MNFLSDKMVRAPETGTGAADDAGAAGAGESGAGEGQGSPPVGTSPAPDYSFLPDDFRKDGNADIEGFRARYDELVAEAAQREEAMQGIPESADGYEIAIPDDIDFGDLDLPDDFAVDLQPDNPEFAPLFDEMRGMLHNMRMPADAGKQMLGLLAKYEATRFSQRYAAAKAEMDSLGNGAQSRIANVERKLQSALPGDLADALKAATQTAAGVKALERLLAPKSVSAGPSQPSGVDTDNLTPRQRLRMANAQRLSA